MNYVPKIDRRSFVIGTAAAGAGLTLGMTLPFGAAEAQATRGAPRPMARAVASEADRTG
jgi:isoquinoline 1-oxidoreductase beta subunit